MVSMQQRSLFFQYHTVANEIRYYLFIPGALNTLRGIGVVIYGPVFGASLPP